MTGALTGVRVIELAQAMQGPWAGQLLGDMGADVVKVERPGTGDAARWPGVVPADGDPWFFLAMNRNKRSVALDLKSPDGVATARRLIERADVVIENFRPQTMERLGLGYAELRAANPRLVYASATGWGAEGPLAGARGQDLLAQAFSGAMSLGGAADGPPTASGMFVADGLGATLLAFAVVAALYARERTGEGQRVETNLLDALIHLQTQELVTFLNTGVAAQRGPAGGHGYLEGPYGTYAAADGHVVLSIMDLDELAEALEQPDLPARFGDGDLWRDRDRLHALVAPVIAQQTVAHWTARFAELDLMAAPVQDHAALVAHPQVAANRMVEHLPGGDGADLALTGIPIRFSATPGSIRRRPPRLGEHTDEVLAELGPEA